MNSNSELDFSQNLMKMKNDFDTMFTIPVKNESLEFVNLLTIKFGENYFALKTSEISGLFRNKKVVPLPSENQEFLGISGIQGQSVPVYSLASLVGFNETTQEQVRWLVVSGQKNKVGWAFDNLKGYMQLPSTELFVPHQTDKLREHVSGAVRIDSKIGYVLSISSMLKSIKQKTGLAVAIEEE